MTDVSEKYGLVVFMDILATKGISQFKQAKSYLDRWHSFIFSMDGLVQNLNSYDNISCNEISTTKEIEYEINILTFSDTIIITLSMLDERKLGTAFSLIGGIVMELFFLGLEQRLLFRGVISAGHFFGLKTSSYLFAGVPVSKDFTPTKKFLYVGPAVDEVAIAYDKSNWIGVSTMPSATVKLNQLNNDVEVMKFFAKLEITKYGVEHNGWALAWPLYDSTQNSWNPSNKSHFNYLKEEKSKYQKRPNSKRIFLKYNNTIKFYDDFKKMIFQ